MPSITLVLVLTLLDTTLQVLIHVLLEDGHFLILQAVLLTLNLLWCELDLFDLLQILWLLVGCPVEIVVIKSLFADEMSTKEGCCSASCCTQSNLILLATRGDSSVGLL